MEVGGLVKLLSRFLLKQELKKRHRLMKEELEPDKV